LKPEAMASTKPYNVMPFSSSLNTYHALWPLTPAVQGMKAKSEWISFSFIAIVQVEDVLTIDLRSCHIQFCNQFPYYFDNFYIFTKRKHSTASLWHMEIASVTSFVFWTPY
jgi:hypothetical protein